MRIHIFESDSSTADCMREVINDLGCTALIAESCASALTLLFTQPAQMVILNQHLLGGSVERIVEECRKRRIKIVCISTAKNGLSGCDDFIRAPFNISELERVINFKNFS